MRACGILAERSVGYTPGASEGFGRYASVSIWRSRLSHFLGIYISVLRSSHSRGLHYFGVMYEVSNPFCTHPERRASVHGVQPLAPRHYYHHRKRAADGVTSCNRRPLVSAPFILLAARRRDDETARWHVACLLTHVSGVTIPHLTPRTPAALGMRQLCAGQEDQRRHALGYVQPQMQMVQRDSTQVVRVCR